MEKKAGLVSKLTTVGFSANCCLIHDFPFLWKKFLPGQMFLSQHFPWRSHSVLFAILYVAMENFRINFPYCLRSALFAVQITVFLYLVFFKLCEEKVLKK